MEGMLKLQSNDKKPKQSSNCNICRNFKSMLDPSHRRSKVHQRKLNEKFSVIKAKMKEIKPDCICVHDEEWHNSETMFCYFCSEPLSKHEVFDGVTVENLGYLRHLSSDLHQAGVIKYLKFQGRKEEFRAFCKPKGFLKTFLDNIPDAKKKYFEKLKALDDKDVKKIREAEAEREKLMEESFQERTSDPTCLHSEVPQRACYSRIKQVPEGFKTPPWQLTKSENNGSSEQPDTPVIGPTMDTLTKHVKNRKKKFLPPTRLQTHVNMKKKTKLNKRWLPPFSGVWNKGRTRQLKYDIKNEK